MKKNRRKRKGEEEEIKRIHRGINFILGWDGTVGRFGTTLAERYREREGRVGGIR